uniref:Solute carrier family 35 member F5 n=1 Tax=Bombyx mori TaxID=7091 RepID=A0A8R2M514_BOMMO|nr:solute carrier family 35 member F5 isoform X3 [Bombyx mori]
MLTLCHNYFHVSPNNKNKDVVQEFNRKKYVFGVFILLLVVVLWVVSSEMTKYLYTEKHLERPFLVTYVRSSLLFIYLLVLCFSPPTKDPCRPTDYTGDSTFIPVRAGETTDSDDAAPRAVRFNKVAEVRVMSAAMASEALLARLSWAASERAAQVAQRRAAAAATRRHLRLALFLSMPWFISNYLYRLSILHTSTSSATMYTSTTGAFVLTLGAIFAEVPTDRFTISKSVAVLLTAAGLVVLGISESHQSNWTAVLSALGSAFCYAIHLLLFRRELRKGEGINSPLLIGVVGCIVGGAAWSVGGALAAAGVERAALPSPPLWPWLILDAALGPVLIDSLWIWGRSLTGGGAASGVVWLAAPAAVCAEAGGAARVAAALLTAAGCVLAAAPAPCISALTRRLKLPNPISNFRNIPELDEQSEALMSSDEPT